ncbi:uncharacterized protein LOC129235275 [Uloborus diversus]|uniref:uncharacterized protein LOC129235275 n=1 Tax=Uloborus diversus TaxID=327109 RepID=UPI00240A392F|nr:uncharacterized protein LOC129235275 [Uloborus diversus]
MLLQDVGLGLASNEYIYYAANSVGIMDSLLALASRARVSKVVSRNETGKIFSFMSTAQTIVPIVAAIAVSQVLNATLNFFPGLIFLVFAALSTIPIGVFIWILRLPKMEDDETDGVPNTVAEEKTAEATKDIESERV